LAGTDTLGEVSFVQRVRLTIDAQKGAGTSKLTDGVMANAFVRLPGPTDGPLLLAEGPETALSVWAATGYATLASIGSITRHEPPGGRRIVLCRDDDRLQSQADRALKTAIASWHGAGMTSESRHHINMSPKLSIDPIPKANSPRPQDYATSTPSSAGRPADTPAVSWPIFDTPDSIFRNDFGNL
jgi:hypothetical protein